LSRNEKPFLNPSSIIIPLAVVKKGFLILKRVVDGTK
jgi:hypothetical protein